MSAAATDTKLAALRALLRREACPPVRESWRTCGRFAVRALHWGPADAQLAVLLLHGGGANAQLLEPFAAEVAASGLQAVAVDLPAYGRSRALHGGRPDYEDWCAVAHAMVDECAATAALYAVGFSMGGLLAYEAVSRSRAQVQGLMVTSLLDPTNPLVRRHLVRWPWMAGLAPALLAAVPALSDGLPLRMNWASNMQAVSALSAVSRLICADRASGGAWMSARFLRTYLEHRPVRPPEGFDRCPVMLALPERDAWTPPSLSLAFARTLHAPWERTMLAGASHLPFESLESGGFAAALRRLRELAGR